LSAEITIEDRLGQRTRPGGPSLMHQHWGKLLFMHWPIDSEVLRPLIPSQLSIDTFDGAAWIGAIPFTMWGVRASFLPPIPGTSAFHELNVRTYVHFNGTPGVWFFSLDAANSLAVWGARTFYHLPYFNADMNLKQSGPVVDYSSTRTDSLTYAQFFGRERHGFPADFNADRFRSLPRAELSVKWTIGECLPQSASESLAFFLTERYCLYSYHNRCLYRSRIFHEPWPLRNATLPADEYRSTMIGSLGVPEPASQPVLHYADSIAVEIWRLKKL